MSTTPARISTNDSTSTSAFRVNYSEYVADITGSPKSTRKLPSGGIGHHINPLHNPYPNRQNPPQKQQQQTGGMPQYGGGSEKCARCLKSVYLAEKKIGAGRAFHSCCFNCYSCKRKLDSSTLSEHKGEIYCKPCYTKQFGAHGLISGVSMSTEQTSTSQSRYSRRSSFGNDLDTPAMSYQQTRQRANSTENILRDDYGSTQNDRVSQKYPRDNNISREQNSPSSSNQKTNGVDVRVDSNYRRSPSPINFERPLETNSNDNRYQTNYAENSDRKKYAYEGEKLTYGDAASAMVNIPVMVQPKRTDQTIDRMEMPFKPIKENQRSRSPSVTSNDSYQRQNSREQQNNLSDDYSRLNINETNNNRDTRKYSDDKTINAVVSDNPYAAQNYRYSASSSSSYETKYRGSTSNANSNDREQYHSRDLSPSINTNRTQLPFSTGGFTSSSSAAAYTASSTHRTGTSRDPASPSTTYAPQRDYYNTQTSSNSHSSDRRSSSPQNSARNSSGLNDFVAKTNLAGNTSPTIGNKFSTLGALINNPQKQNNDDSDY